MVQVTPEIPVASVITSAIAIDAVLTVMLSVEGVWSEIVGGVLSFRVES